MDNKKEETITLPDGKMLRVYVYPDGKRMMDIDDVIKALKNPINKEFLQNEVSKYAQSQNIIPKEKEKTEIKLSDFNEKLKQGLNWNPKEHKK